MSGAKLPDKISGFVVNQQKIQCEMVFILYKSWEVFQSRVELLFWKVFRVFWLVFLLLRHSSILESKLGLIQKVFQFVQEWVFESWSIQKQMLNTIWVVDKSQKKSPLEIPSTTWFLLVGQENCKKYFWGTRFSKFWLYLKKCQKIIKNTYLRMPKI